MGAALPEGKPGPRQGARDSLPRPKLSSQAVERIARRLDRVFDSLEDQSYLGAAELADFYYFRTLFDEALGRIDRKVVDGRIKPLDLRGFPQELRYPGLSAKLGVFIGSFDPFQMTHLATALRFLASEDSEADALFVVPEGSVDPAKPLKTDYRFRYEILKRQIAGIFEPLVVPLDIGEGADTIGIVERLIGLHPGACLKLTHLLGSDVLPKALGFLPADLEAWGRAARKGRVEFDFSIYVARRDPHAELGGLVEAARRLGPRVVVDEVVVGTPSSTAFRSEGAITLVLPTESILSRLELLFRYGMYRAWSGGGAQEPFRVRGEQPSPERRGTGGDGRPEYEI
jgi:Nicotinic acid mononucleotide adenylyltransferase